MHRFAFPVSPMRRQLNSEALAFDKPAPAPATHAEASDHALTDAMRYRALVELSPDAIVVCRSGTMVLLNQAACRLLGTQNPLRLLGKSILDIVHSDFHAMVRHDLMAAGMDSAPSPLREQIWMREDGSYVHVEIAVSVLMYEDGPALQISARDIGERKRLSELQVGQSCILNMVATGMPLIDILNAITRLTHVVSDRQLYTHVLIHSEGTRLPAEVPDRIPDLHADGTQCTTETRDGEGLRLYGARSIRGKEGHHLGKLLVYARTEGVVAKHGDLLDMCARLAAIALESRASQDRIRRLAHYDGLTALPNRFLFQEYLDLALRNARRHGSRFAVLFLDLDEFKSINDRFGHAAGDEALKQIASRLRSTLRSSDKIARMGGDEFYALLEELHDPGHAAEVARKLVQEVRRPLNVNGRTCTVGVSIGIAIYPDDGSNAAGLLENADRAMYGAKAEGKNSCRFFSATLSDRVNKEKADAYCISTD